VGVCAGVLEGEGVGVKVARDARRGELSFSTILATEAGTNR